MRRRDLEVGGQLLKIVLDTIYGDFCAEKYTHSCKTPQKIAAIRSALFDSNMHQIFCRLGFAPDPTGGAYSAPQPLALFKI